MRRPNLAKGWAKWWAAKAEAEVWAIKTDARILEGMLPAVIRNIAVPQVGKTAADIFERYANEVSPNKRGGCWKQIRIKGMAACFPVFDQPIASITGPDIADWRDVRLLAVSASTVNRELSLISAVFTHAMKEWRVGLTSNRCSLVAKPRPRTQRISVTERKQIIGELGWDGKSEPERSGQWVAFAFTSRLRPRRERGRCCRFVGPISALPLATPVWI